VSNEIWTSVNERYMLGDDLVSDYVTRVQDGGFYGWPYSYLVSHEDPRRKGERPDLVAKAIVPDVLLQSHSAPLGLVFYTGTQFPAAHLGDAFVALHGSWNRKPRTGHKVVRVPIRDGKASVLRRLHHRLADRRGQAGGGAALSGSPCTATGRCSSRTTRTT
jgi:glucose/arabinose dehydrogenase